MKKNFLKKNCIYIFITLSIFISMFLYVLNFETFNNYSSTDFRQRYQPNGIVIIEQIINLSFKDINFINFYFIPEVITGLMIKVFPDEILFSIAINTFNLILMTVSFAFFFKSIKVNSIFVYIFFLIFYYFYIPNYIWAFWKLADIYFLFVFSVIFYLLSEGIKRNKFNYLIYCFCICLIALLTKPQGLVVIPFFVYCLILIKFFKKNFFFIKLIIFISFFLIFPIIVYLMIKFDLQNYITKAFNQGRVSHNILISYENFLNQFSFINNNLIELLYYYYLCFQKLIFQLTFIRETYSFNHNFFLLIYILIIYFFLIINLDYLILKYNLFFKLTFSSTFFAILLYCSTFTGSEPNRFQLFYLVPTYILASISMYRSLKLFIIKIYK